MEGGREDERSGLGQQEGELLENKIPGGKNYQRCPEQGWKNRSNRKVEDMDSGGRGGWGCWRVPALVAPALY